MMSDRRGRGRRGHDGDRDSGGSFFLSVRERGRENDGLGSSRGASEFGGRGRGRDSLREQGRGAGLAQGPANGTVTWSQEFKKICRYRDLRLVDMKTFVQAALLSLDEPTGDALVLSAVGDPSDAFSGARGHMINILKTWAASASNTPAVYLDVIVPLLRLAAHNSLRDSLRSHLVNPFYQVLEQHLDLVKVATTLEQLHAQGLLTGAMPQEPASQAASASNGADTKRAEPWRAKTWLCVLEPAVVLVREMLERFQMDHDYVKLKTGAEALAQKAQQIMDLVWGTHGASRAQRLLQRDLDKINSLLGRGNAVSNAIDQGLASAAQRRAQHLAAQSNAELRIAARIKDPTNVPGALRPSGPRHSNDHADISHLRIVPTSDELLCAEEPYLPCNRPGGIPHAQANPEAAHLELHFRLLREDAIGPLRAAMQSFKTKGGLEQLTIQQTKKKQGVNRVHLGDISLSAFRNVCFHHLDVTKVDGLCLWVSFDQPANMAEKSHEELKEIWEKSKRLAAGSLVALWWEPDGPQDPRIELAVVAATAPKERLEKLAPRQGRPSLCLRLFLSQSDFMLTLMHAGVQSMGEEIVMVQENNSFFAYEPILKALQTMKTIPLSSILLPAAPTSGPLRVDVPAYVLGTKYDLTCLVSKDKQRSCTPAEWNRILTHLQNVDMSGPDNFPDDLLQQATSLDKAQTLALRDALLHEVAVMQGPPGTGKTFLGVKLLQVLLSNTCNKQHVPQRRLDEGGIAALDELVERRWVTDGKADVGPILVVCFTNHALDSFLEDIYASGATDSLIRVGGRSESEVLRPFNLSNMGSRAGGRHVALQRELLEALQKRVEALQQDLFAAATTKALTWEVAERSGVIRQVFSAAQCDYFELGRRPWNRKGKEAVDEDGFQMASKRSYTDLLLDWVRKTPAKDWAVGRLGELPQDIPWAQLQDHIPPHVLHTLFMNRPLEELQQVVNVWTMSRSEREVMYAQLQRLMLAGLAGELQGLATEIDVTRKRLQAEYDITSLEALSKARIVGITTSGLARMQPLIQAIRPRIVIVEEAAEVFEPHILTSLSKYTEHLILIGDHEQLRPKPNVYELQAISGRGYDLDVSMFERLVTRTGLHVARLAMQHRMRPEISSLIRGPVYPHLTDAPRVFGYPHIPGMTTDVFFFDHDHREGGEDGDADGRSKYNAWEAEFAVGLASYLMLQGIKPEDIVILVPYVGQLFAMRKQLAASKLRMVASERDEEDMARNREQEEEEEEGEESHNGALEGAVQTSKQLRVATVDNFQGEEAKVIVLSTTRNNKGGKIGFLKTRNRINVMLSRAQWGMYILGNKATLEANADHAPMWSEVLKQLEAKSCVGSEIKVRCQLHGHETPIAEASQWRELVGDGGCQRQCENLLLCGHPCPRRCHVDDPAHKGVRCVQDCDRIHKPCNHPCHKRCFEPCGKCVRVIKEPITLPCGHEAAGFQCWMQYVPGELKCMVKLEVKMPGCGHILELPCCQVEEVVQSPELCHMMVSVSMPACEHEMKVACGKKQAALSNPLLCSATCGASMACGHSCTGSCGGCLTLTIQKSPEVLTSGWLRVLDQQQHPGLAEAWSSSDQARAPVPSLAHRWLTWLTADRSRSGLLAKWLDSVKHKRLGTPSSSRSGPAFSGYEQQHQACTVPCKKLLFCGHECSSACHHGQPCPPCSKPCGLGCEHVSKPCPMPCSIPCVVCAKDCSWACAHKGRCSVPCGAPCDRLPCDQRCESILKCGHRCASVCGEACNSQLCVHPECKAKCSEDFKSQTVDMVLLQSFEDITSESVDEDPLIMLDCGHVFTMGTLDGCVNISESYLRASDGSWLAPNTLSGAFEKPPSCPNCRRPIAGVKRYGRATKKSVLDLQDRRFLYANANSLQQLRSQIKAVPEAAEAHITAATCQLGPGLTRGAAVHQLRMELDRAFDVSRRVDKALAQLASHCSSQSPKQRVFEAAIARLGRLVDEEMQEHQQEDQQLVEEGRQGQGKQGQDGEGQQGQGKQGRDVQGQAQLQQQGQVSKEELHEQHSMALQVSAEMASVLGPDMGQLCRVRAAIMEAKEATLQILKTGLKICDRGLLQMQALTGPRGTPRYVATTTAELSKVAVSQVQKVDAIAAWLLRPKQDAAPANPQAWFEEAITARTYSSAFLLARSHLQLLLAVVSTLEARKTALLFKVAWDSNKEVQKMQLSLLDQAETFGVTALAHLGDRVAKADLKSFESDFLEKLPAVKKQISGDAEMEDMLAALAAATMADRAGDDLLGYLANHLYRCPAGHVYTIANCGMPMEESYCPECGAIIGGRSHVLQYGNAHASGTVAQLRQHSLQQPQA